VTADEAEWARIREWRREMNEVFRKKRE